MKTISREEVVKLVTKCRLTFNSRDELLEFLEDVGDGEVELENKVFEALSELYMGVSNGYLSELYEGVTGKKVEVIGDIAEMFQCPCCNYKTLSEIYNQEDGTGYDICDYCNWEDDGTVDIDSPSSVNKGCIKEYRDKIKARPNLFYRNKWLRN
ncbi:CPCC family cysteine-rich protein [Microbulbifer sp. DLAB2-AA]|uniref:CPCC family cysteine-rich protein n=1 Tax=Microbulbifer sp. DLAB2-AA TaxID=3243394 RepID=UPI0040393428